LDGQVYRIYDNRFRVTSRSALLYEKWGPLKQDPPTVLDCTFVGKDKEKIESIEGFSGCQSLKLIKTPYRKGRHVAKRPTDFVPIIECLDELHKSGFVHGDIRAFNMVFAEREGDGRPEGWLIDFDFGGEEEVAKYPLGYKQSLDDGTREGQDGQPIPKWHDWIALGHVIFTLHKWKTSAKEDPSYKGKVRGRDDLRDLAEILADKWTEWREESPLNITDEDIEELKTFLREIEAVNWMVTSRGNFKTALDKKTQGVHGTFPNATGSPVQKK
jgi:dsDNA-binding SOS-regulon protein